MKTPSGGMGAPAYKRTPGFYHPRGPLFGPGMPGRKTGGMKPGHKKPRGITGKGTGNGVFGGPGQKGY